MSFLRLCFAGVLLVAAHGALRSATADSASSGDKADPGPDGKLTSAQMTAVRTPLFKARTLQPLLPETYELIAEAWAASSTPAETKHLGVLDEGVRQFPRDSALVYNTAKLYEQTNQLPTALAITQLGVRFARDPADKTRLEEPQNALAAKAK